MKISKILIIGLIVISMTSLFLIGANDKAWAGEESSVELCEYGLN